MAESVISCINACIRVQCWAGQNRRTLEIRLYRISWVPEFRATIAKYEDGSNYTSWNGKIHAPWCIIGRSKTPEVWFLETTKRPMPLCWWQMCSVKRDRALRRRNSVIWRILQKTQRPPHLCQNNSELETVPGLFKSVEDGNFQETAVLAVVFQNNLPCVEVDKSGEFDWYHAASTECASEHVPGRQYSIQGRHQILVRVVNLPLITEIMVCVKDLNDHNQVCIDYTIRDTAIGKSSSQLPGMTT